MSGLKTDVTPVRLLVCGGAGFIGSAMCRAFSAGHLEGSAGGRLHVLDAYTYAGNPQNITSCGLSATHGRIEDKQLVCELFDRHQFTHVVNFAAETHNDRSLHGPEVFAQTNVMGLMSLLEALRTHGKSVKSFVHVSTDEVYGSLEAHESPFTENSPLLPNSPYSASKAAGDLMIRGYVKAFGLPVIITRGGNTYGPYQYPEKVIPLSIIRWLCGQPAYLYDEGAARRQWIHVDDHVRGIWTALMKGRAGEVYNVGDDNECTIKHVLDTCWAMLSRMGTGGKLSTMAPWIQDVRRMQPTEPYLPVQGLRGAAHDLRYTMDCSKLHDLGWSPKQDFTHALGCTVQWYAQQRQWWERTLRQPEYTSFMTQFYNTDSKQVEPVQHGRRP